MISKRKRGGYVLGLTKELAVRSWMGGGEELYYNIARMKGAEQNGTISMGKRYRWTKSFKKSVWKDWGFSFEKSKGLGFYFRFYTNINITTIPFYLYNLHLCLPGYHVIKLGSRKIWVHIQKQSSIKLWRGFMLKN